MAVANLPRIIVLALGAPAVGAPGVLALLRDVAGRNAAADVIFTVFLIAAVTSLVLGTMLLTRYIRVAAGAYDGARARAHQRGTALFARLTLGVALAVAVFSTACLLAVPSVPHAGELDGAATSCSAC